ncbi:riboflavin synthase [Granulosicoccaceae sp. 1_MG-2023]|nr:riboflavin synthase [Granulosicoccaceae sp. 1_MG-2023]
MFTGIIQSVGTVAGITSQGVDKRVRINTGKIDTAGIALGDSIAVNGVCLTAVAIDAGSFTADVSGETIAHTTFRDMQQGTRVNLELALTPQTHLGGHMVSGHVDGVGEVLSIREDGKSLRYEFSIDPSLQHYVARKGSICINGVSLTVNGVSGNRFDVNLVPHTVQETTLGDLKAGSPVNLEVDIIARYLERLLSGGMPAREGAGRIDEEFLAKAGIIST